MEICRNTLVSKAISIVVALKLALAGNLVVRIFVSVARPFAATVSQSPLPARMSWKSTILNQTLVIIGIILDSNLFYNILSLCYR